MPEIEAQRSTGNGTARGMGRGLSAILPRSPRDAEGLRALPVDLVRPNPNQPRRDFDAEALLALSESIKARGVLQPIVVRPLHGGAFELVAGERRLRAAKMAGLEEIPAIVRATEDSERLELALIENMARENLNPIEEARACATLVEDLGVTKEELGRRVGRSRVAVSNLIRLLDLPDEALDMIAAGELSAGHGRALLMCKDQTERRRLARAARAEGWSVRETEERARRAERGSGQNHPRGPQVVVHPDLSDLVAAAEDALSAALARDVKVRIRKGRCRVEFELDDPREAVELAARLVRQPAA